jgi:hypothetical protein
MSSSSKKSGKENQRTPEQQVKLIKTTGIVLLSVYLFIFLLFGILHFLSAPWGDKELNFIFLVVMCISGIGTGFHLWTRYPKFPQDSPFRNLFKLMGFTFIPLFAIFTIQNIDSLLNWAQLPSIFGTINSLVGSIVFDFFNLPQFHTTMPAESLIVFGFIIVSILFYLYPMEKFNNKKIWRMYILIILFILLPFAPIIANSGSSDLNTWLLSIMTSFIVLFVVYCFVYLFYLYFSTARKGTGTMKKGGMMVAFGLLLLILTWVVGWALPAAVDINTITKTIIQYGIGVSAMVLYNWGFYILRPIS